MKTLERLQNWYQKQCDGYWEHDYGIKIGNLDNPGWEIKVDLTGTNLEGKEFQEIKIERNENDWLVCRLEEKRFRGYGGLRNLDELLQIFLDWAEK